MTLRFLINDSLFIHLVESLPITADSNNFIKCCFEFQGDVWENAEKRAVFKYGEEDLIEKDGELYCYVKAENNKFGSLTLGVKGTKFNKDGLLSTFYTNAIELWNIPSIKASVDNSGGSASIKEDITASDVFYNNNESKIDAQTV